MRRKRMVARFRFPYTERQVYVMLLAACKSEVALRHRRFMASAAYLNHIADIARWLTSDDTTFGLFLCGNRGNGKTTLVKAMKSLYNYLHSDEGYTSQDERWPLFGFEIITAKELVLLAGKLKNGTVDETTDTRISELIRAAGGYGYTLKKMEHFKNLAKESLEIFGDSVARRKRVPI